MLNKLEVGNKIVDSEYLSRGVGEVSLVDPGAVSVLYADNNMLVVYPVEHMKYLIVV